MASASCTLETTVGAFVFSVACEGLSEKELSIRLDEIRLTPCLPAGMSINRCRAIVARIRPSIMLPHVQWMCRCRATVSGSPCTGEWLDAQEWESDGQLVVVGTEDAEMLKSRMPFMKSCSEESIVKYSADRIEIFLRNIPAKFDLSLHYVIAENVAPEPVQASGWFAVNVPHGKLLSLVAAGNR